MCGLFEMIVGREGLRQIVHRNAGKQVVSVQVFFMQTGNGS